MICQRQRRLELQAHEAATDVCIRSGRELGLTLACEDEGKCSDPTACPFFQEALANEVAFDGMLP